MRTSRFKHWKQTHPMVKQKKTTQPEKLKTKKRDNKCMRITSKNLSKNKKLRTKKLSSRLKTSRS